MLSPYLARGEAEEARVAAEVHGFDVTSYAGFLSVRPNKHTYFWYFPKVVEDSSEMESGSTTAGGTKAGENLEYLPLFISLTDGGFYVQVLFHALCRCKPSNSFLV
jgi:hypothetical protein